MRTAHVRPSPSVRRVLATVLSGLSLLVLGAGRAGADDEVTLPPPLTAQQLDDLVAPIALYPDLVLDALLPASTRPGEVRAAAALSAALGERAIAAPMEAHWDASVIALLQVPDVLRWLGENSAWVERLGYAVLIQQPDVLDAVQRYRMRAYLAGVFGENPYVRVWRQQDLIYVVSLSPRVVYVPVYDPWALQGWRAGRSFFSAWFGFSFGSSGYWTRHRIAWGVGIYDYASPLWYGSWRSGADDWRTGRPTRWSAPQRADQPWARRGWSTGSAIVRPNALRSVLATGSTREVRIAPPRDGFRIGGSRSSEAPRWQPPRDPAAPITRWRPAAGEPARERAPRSTTVPVPRSVPLLPPVRLAPFAPGVPRAPVIDWSRRGNRSLEGAGAPREPAPRRLPQATPPVVAPRPPQAAPRPPLAAPRVLPPRSARPPALDGAHARRLGERGRRSLLGE